MKGFHALAIVLAAVPCAVFAQPYSSGQGGIVTREDSPVYMYAEGDEVLFKLKRGETVGTATVPRRGDPFSLTAAVSLSTSRLDDRVLVSYFEPGRNRPTPGWMNPSDLSRFSLGANCSRSSLLVPRAGGGVKWSACFEQARDGKLAELQPTWGTAAAAAKKEPAKP